MIEIIEQGENRLVIKDQPKNLDDFLRFREALQEKKNAHQKELEIVFIDATYLSSSMFGVMLKFKNSDSITINLHIKDRNLWKLTEEVGLIEEFNTSRYRD